MLLFAYLIVLNQRALFLHMSRKYENILHVSNTDLPTRCVEKQCGVILKIMHGAADNM